MTPAAKHIPSRIDQAKVVEVIEVRWIRGCGQSNDDPVRQIIGWFDKGGALLAEVDMLSGEAVGGIPSLVMGERT